MPRSPRVSDKELLAAFERLCKKYGRISRGFEPEQITYPAMGDAYDGTPQWAICHREGFGYMVVCGAGGCGCALTRSGGYIRTRWDFLIFMEALAAPWVQ